MTREEAASARANYAHLLAILVAGMLPKNVQLGVKDLRPIVDNADLALKVIGMKAVDVYPPPKEDEPEADADAGV